MIILPAFSNELTGDTVICGRHNKLGRVPPGKGVGEKFEAYGDCACVLGGECVRYILESERCADRSKCACVLEDARKVPTLCLPMASYDQLDDHYKQPESPGSHMTTFSHQHPRS